MNLTDFIIIYLACGAPFGVHFFLQQRAASNCKNLWLKTLLAFVFWIPLAVLLIRKIKNAKWLAVSNLNRNFSGEPNFAEQTSAIQKNLETLLLESDTSISLFEFRRTLERYANLTALLNDEAETLTEREKEIFRAAKITDVEIAAVCLHRRNRKRLAFHQTEARKDFLQMIEVLSDSVEDTKKFKNLTDEFVRLLNDASARESIEKSFAAKSQTIESARVKNLEKEVLWKPEMHERLHIKTARKPIGNLTAMTRLRSKD